MRSHGRWSRVAPLAIGLAVIIGGSASVVVLADQRGDGNGTVGAAQAPLPAAYSTFRDRARLPEVLNTITSLTVPAGKYVITAKLQVLNITRDVPTSVNCKLVAGNRTDIRELVALPPVNAGESGLVEAHGIQLQTTASFTARRQITLRCEGSETTTTFADHINIIAIRVASLQVT